MPGSMVDADWLSRHVTGRAADVIKVKIININKSIGLIMRNQTLTAHRLPTAAHRNAVAVHFGGL